MPDIAGAHLEVIASGAAEKFENFRSGDGFGGRL